MHSIVSLSLTVALIGAAGSALARGPPALAQSHGPGGYRDLDRRFNAQNPEVQMAKETPAGAKVCM